MKSADDLKALITEKLNLLLRESVDISSLTLSESTITTDLKVLSYVRLLKQLVLYESVHTLIHYVFPRRWTTPCRPK